MATKSILKSINIRDKSTAKAFVNALENASGKSAKPVTHARIFTDASKDEIRKMFRTEK